MLRSMGRWPVVLGTTTAAFLAFLVRSWLDWRFVYGEFIPATDGVTMGLAIGVYVLVCLAWLVAIVGIAREQRVATKGAFVLALMLLVLGGLATTFSLCQTPCATPFMDVANFAGIVIGLEAAIAAWTRLREPA
jgi:hypothetical protein